MGTAANLAARAGVCGAEGHGGSHGKKRSATGIAVNASLAVPNQVSGPSKGASLKRFHGVSLNSNRYGCGLAWARASSVMPSSRRLYSAASADESGLVSLC